MIMVRIYRALSEINVEVTAHVRQDPMGEPIEARGVFVGRAFLDGTTALNPEDIDQALYAVLERASEAIAAEWGGYGALC